MNKKMLLDANEKLAEARKRLQATRRARTAAQTKIKRIRELKDITTRTVVQENELQHLLSDVELLTDV